MRATVGLPPSPPFHGPPHKPLPLQAIHSVKYNFNHVFLEEDTIADLFSRESTIVSSALYTAASEGVCAPSGTEEGNGRCPSSVWTRPGAVKQGQPGGPVGTAEQGTGRGRREVRRGATRARGDVKPKGTATCGGKRFRERTRGNGGSRAVPPASDSHAMRRAKTPLNPPFRVLCGCCRGFVSATVWRALRRRGGAGFCSSRGWPVWGTGHCRVALKGDGGGGISWQVPHPPLCGPQCGDWGRDGPTTAPQPGKRTKNSKTKKATTTK